MKKIAMLLSGLFIAIVLVGCTTKQDTSIQSNTTENTTWIVSNEKHTWVTICDNYITTIKCLADSTTGSNKQNFDSSYKSLIQSFQNVPADQLTQTCTTLSQSLRTHPTLLKDYPNCNKL